MPTREAALTELDVVSQVISDEYAERKQALPVDNTEILNA